MKTEPNGHIHILLFLSSELLLGAMRMMMMVVVGYCDDEMTAIWSFKLVYVIVNYCIPSTA